MSTNSAIEWTEATWNPIAGCTPVSPGCLNCYAATMSHRLEAMGQPKYRGLTVLHNGVRTFNGTIRFDKESLAIPVKRRKPSMYFVNSMSDLFHEEVQEDWLHQIFYTMEQEARQHTYQILTKRPANAERYLTWRWGNGRIPSRHIWIGCSPVNQKTYDEYADHLWRTPAQVRFLSLEPLQGPIDLGLMGVLPKDICPSYTMVYQRLHWVIVGGESGPGARPCNVEWVRDIVSQCGAADVPVFVKQLGAHVIDNGTTSATHFEPEQCWPDGTKTDYHRVLLRDKKGGDPAEWPEDLRVREMPAARATA